MPNIENLLNKNNGNGNNNGNKNNNGNDNGNNNGNGNGNKNGLINVLENKNGNNNGNGNGNKNGFASNEYNLEKKLFSFEKKKNEQIKSLKTKNNVMLYIIIGLLVFNLATLFISFNLMFSVLESEKNQALMKQEVYNIKDYIERNSKETIAIQEIQQVIYHYNYKYYKKNPEKVKKIAELIYRVGYLKYNIPIEEWLILFSMESDWNRYALSPKGARGIAQLMEETARWLCYEVKIPWQGVDMLWDEITSIQLGMYYYKFLKEKYENNPRYYIVAYNWGETLVYPYWSSTPKKKINSSYLKHWYEEKEIIEQILGRKIYIKGMEEKKEENNIKKFKIKFKK